MTIPNAIAYSPHTTLASGCDTTTDTECEVTSLAVFPDVAAGELGIIVFCAEDDFRSVDPADFETMTYTAKNAGTDELEGLVHREGTARAWGAGTYVACYGTAWAWEQVRSTINTHIAEDDTDDVHGYTTYIDNLRYDNAGAHNSIYRGKSLGTEYTQAQSDVIAAGTFDDLYIGDYWTIDGVVYRIAAFDYFYNVGDTGDGLTTHHAVIVPDTAFADQKMEDTNITTNGYAGSKMRTDYIATAKTACKAAFTIGESVKVLNHRQLLCNASSAGLASGWAWTDCEVELMNEVMVYGSIAWDSGGGQSGYNVSSSNGVLPLFALRHDLVNIRVTYWLRDVVSATDFANVYNNGLANNVNASFSRGVRPAFSIS